MAWQAVVQSLDIPAAGRHDREMFDLLPTYDLRWEAKLLQLTWLYMRRCILANFSPWSVPDSSSGNPKRHPIVSAAHTHVTRSAAARSPNWSSSKHENFQTTRRRRHPRMTKVEGGRHVERPGFSSPPRTPGHTGRRLISTRQAANEGFHRMVPR